MTVERGQGVEWPVNGMAGVPLSTADICSEYWFNRNVLGTTGTLTSSDSKNFPNSKWCLSRMEEP